MRRLFMISLKTAREMLLKLEGVTEKDHFENDTFYTNKRIFATIVNAKNNVNVRLPLDLQKSYLETDGEVFIEVNNAWGRQGWTTIQLEFIDKILFSDVIKVAWNFSGMKLGILVKKKSKAKKKKKSK
jgi:cell wall assembly regulator SMI1